jgi:cbb3-type cytochrome oxidase maturation protein
MEILILLVFVSLMLLAAALLSFGYSIRQGDHEQAERLSLLPLDSDEAPVAAAPELPSDKETR